MGSKNTSKYRDGVKRDPEAALGHEIMHLYRYTEGTNKMVKNPMPKEGDKDYKDKEKKHREALIEEELETTGHENEYRKSQGLEQRKYYSDPKYKCKQH